MRLPELKGRHWLLLWLLLFVAVAAIVVTRQTAAIATAGRLRRLREDRLALEARRADLERRIRDASSRRVLGQRAAQSLGLRQPADTELGFVRLPPVGAPR
jgi:hypothetical protein